MIATKSVETLNFDFFSYQDSDGPLYLNLKGQKDKPTEIVGAYDDFITHEARGVSLLLIVWDNQ